MKICLKCKIEKELNLFTKDKNRKDGLNPYCIPCRKEQKRNYYLMNRKNILTKCKEYREENRDIVREKARRYYKENPQIIKETKRREYLKNKERYKIESKKRQIAKKEEIALYQKQYRQTHREERNNRHKQRFSIDFQYRLSMNLRSRLLQALKKDYKSGSAIKDLGCTIEQFKDWIERQWEPGMSWDNYGNKEGQWSIDHEYPLSLVDISKREQLLPVVHYTNLQPMWHVKNVSKNNSLI